MNRTFITVLIVIGLVAAGVAAYSLGALLRPMPEFGGTGLENPQPVSDIRLISTEGEVTLEEYSDNWTVVFFGYTRCPDICPITMSRLGMMYEEMGEPDNLNVLLVTVDPSFDTAQVIDNYARNYHPAFVGLSGTQEMIDEAADRFYIAHQQIDHHSPHHDMHGDIIHSEQVMLVDPNGNFWRIYTPEEQVYLKQDLEYLLGSAS